MNLTDLKKSYKKGNITLEEYKTKYINEIKARLIEKGLSHKERAKVISDKLKTLFKEDIRAIKNSLDSKEITINDIQPIVSYRGKKPNTDLSMRVKKSKGIINRHCYR